MGQRVFVHVCPYIFMVMDIINWQGKRLAIYIAQHLHQPLDVVFVQAVIGS